MITYEKFKEIINHFYNQQDFVESFRTSLKYYDKMEFIDPYCFTDPEADEYIIELLEEMFDDESHWISFYIYELDCGRRWNPGYITDEDGRDIPLSCTEELWNLLLESMV